MNGNMNSAMNAFVHWMQSAHNSAMAGWLAGKPDYLLKLKVPEGYEKMIDFSNI